ncbi:hypothetical protein NPIL_566131 [Nephila pilipes]|uniref:Uncharacterized protein n=1 Tax=Nephila pilipes TaxID=299642 RepID=A0A8X6R9E6_NEPPI|nr:hypothetical protein NPIL_566131 [Nephila pilipes]
MCILLNSHHRTDLLDIEMAKYVTTVICEWLPFRQPLGTRGINAHLRINLAAKTEKVSTAFSTTYNYHFSYFESPPRIFWIIFFLPTCIVNRHLKPMDSSSSQKLAGFPCNLVLDSRIHILPPQHNYPYLFVVLYWTLEPTFPVLSVVNQVSLYTCAELSDPTFFVLSTTTQTFP